MFGHGFGKSMGQGLFPLGWLRVATVFLCEETSLVSGTVLIFFSWHDEQSPDVQN